MKIRDLIALLRQCDQDAEVLVWHPYYDDADSDVHVSVSVVGEVHVGTTVFGTEVLPDE